MEFVETSVFTKQVNKLLSEDDYRQLQRFLTDLPDAGDLIRGSGGVRKLRWGFSSSGKRGGTRIIYYWAVKHDQIFMLLMYPKNKQDNLTAKQIQMMRKIVEDEFDGRCTV